MNNSEDVNEIIMYLVNNSVSFVCDLPVTCAEKDVFRD